MAQKVKKLYAYTESKLKRVILSIYFLIAETYTS